MYERKTYQEVPSVVITLSFSHTGTVSSKYERMSCSSVSRRGKLIIWYGIIVKAILQRIKLRKSHDTPEKMKGPQTAFVVALGLTVLHKGHPTQLSVSVSLSGFPLVPKMKIKSYMEWVVIRCVVRISPHGNVFFGVWILRIAPLSISYVPPCRLLTTD